MPPTRKTKKQRALLIQRVINSVRATSNTNMQQIATAAAAPNISQIVPIAATTATTNIVASTTNVQQIATPPAISTRMTRSRASREIAAMHEIDLLRNQKSILKSRKSTVDETLKLGAQRLIQINFLDKVMYEYLERALYHNIPVEDVNFQEKAEEVKDCMAILKFKPSYAWLINFRKKYGIQDLSKETLRKEIQLKEEKSNSLDPVDMVRYVQQRNNAQTVSNQPKLRNYSRNSADQSLSKTDMSTQQLRKNNNPTIVYEEADEDPVHNDVGVDGATVKLEIAPTKLSEYTGAHPIPQKITIAVPADPTTSDNQHDDSDDDTLTFQKSDVHDIILESESEDDEYLTIYEIIDDEAPSSPAPDNHICSSPLHLSNVENDSQDTKKPIFNESNFSPAPSLSNVENDSHETDISPNTGDGITIKTEPPSNDDELMETNDNQISAYILPEKDVIIKTEASPSPPIDEEDINATIVIERSMNYVMENNNGTNDPQHSTGLAIDHTQLYSNSILPPADVFDEDIKPEKLEELITETNNCANDHHHPPSLATCKRHCSDSPLPDIDTLEEAMRHLKVLENYVMLKENFRAIGLVTQLEDAIKKSPKQ